MNEFQLTTPVVLIIFNRPDTTAKVFQVIRQIKPPKLFVIADAPRPDKPGEVEKCMATRKIIDRVDWKCQVLTNYSEINLGCRERVSSGLNWVFSLVESAIILEDDCVPHLTFFRFCEELLERYRHNDKIMSISGDNFQFGNNPTEYGYYFSRYPHCWGWATWRRAWKNYDNQMQLWSELRDSKWLENILQNTQAVRYWSQIFEDNYQGFNTWDYAWLFAVWSHGKLTIIPQINLVSNIGFGLTATHTKDVNSKFANMSVEEMIFPLNHPPSIIRNIQADDFTEKTMFSGSLQVQNIHCQVCGSISHKFDTAKVLNKYNVDYFQCSNCGFIQTENPYWLGEAYREAIASSDVGLVSRNQNFSLITENLILNFFNANSKFLDYGCGYGLFVRMMRDLGLDFYGYDKYCQNIFYEGWEGEINGEEKYEIVTAFEVFEHFINPLAEIEKILQKTRNILFSTKLLPPDNPRPNDWWYYALEEGQHISIFTKKALSIIAQKFKLNLCSDGESLHLLTEKNFSNSEFFSIFRVGRYKPEKRKEALTEVDHERVKERKQKNQQQLTEVDYENIAERKQISYQQLDFKVLIDGVFFQLNNTGIARVWKSLLEVWSKDSFCQNILVLDRAKTAPKIPGIKYRSVPEYNYEKIDADRQMLQTICDEENADIFISTYYTTPILTPSIFMGYDMIPEILAKNLDDPSWQEKHRSIRQAISYIVISENTARDLVKYFPQISANSVKVARCGIEPKFSRATPQEVTNFKLKYHINRPYFLIVGERIGWLGYKNTILFFQAFAKLKKYPEFEIVCIGGNRKLEPELSKYISGSKIHLLQLSDQELKLAYSGAIALIYPSKYEGFGLPILEAMACGCPVITCKKSSIPEVAGTAALYINDNDVNGLVNALDEVQKYEVRQQLITAGLAQAQNFSWSRMAKIMTDVFIQTFNQIKPKELSAMEGRKNLGEIPFPINHGQLKMQRHFWNVNSLGEAMFGRVFTDDKINAMSPQEKMEAWENSVLSSTEKVLQGVPIKPEWKVLEIGCGVGRLIKYLRENFAQVDGVDISEKMIQFARQYLTDGKQNGEVYVNNGYDLQQLSDENYDFVFSTIVFQHIRSISIVKSYFRETFRVLKPGGYFRLQVHDNSGSNLGNFDEEGAENRQYYLSGNAYTETQLKKLLVGETDFDLVSLEWSKPWIWITVKRPEKQVFSPLVSAIVSTYNSEKFIRGCLEDLVNQTLYQKGKLEIIIIDSASTEKEGDIAQEFQSKYPHIIYQRTPERETIYAAWNRAIKIAKGNYITNANTDDRHRPDALEKMGDYLNNNNDISLVYADQLITTLPNDYWATTQANKCWNWPKFDYQELERRCIIGPQPMWKKSLHEKYGYFRSEFKVAGDYEFWLRIGKNEKIERLPEILGLYFENEQGLEKSSGMAYIETQEIWKTYGIIDRKVKPKLSIPVPINSLEINTSPSTKTLLSTEKKIHILLYTDEPGIYGVGQCNHSILCELIKSGYLVSCVQSKTSNYLIEQQKKIGIQHFWLEYDTVKNFSQTLTNFAEAKQLLTKIKPDTIIFSDCCPFSNLAAKQVAIQLEIPFVVLVNFAAPYLAKRFHSYLGKLSEIYAYSRQTIAVSQENLHQLWELFQLPKQSGKVIYNGRPSKYFTPVNYQVRSRLRQQLGIPENAVLCFTSARLETIKGYQYQLEAIKFLKESNVWSQIYFVWVGSGSLESQLKTEISQLGVTDKVKFLGERDDIPELLDSADIFVFPSQFEGMPLAIMEAMAKGLPVVASAVSGIPEELGETGKLLPDPKIDSQATVKELVETIEEWTINSNLRYSIAQNCQQRAEKMFTEERMLTETLEVIKSALPNQKPLVSVIIPCYKQAHFLSEAVASVVSQTYNNWEIIIVNDGSPDNTSEVARQIIKLFPNHKIDLVEKEKGGCASARNAGINRANGEYILPLDADDKLSSHAISCLMDIAISKSHACVVFGSYEIFGTEERKIITADEYSLENIKKYNMLVCTSLYAKSIYNLTNGYKEEIQESGFEDWEFWLNCHRHNIPFYGIRETILYYRRHPESRVVKSFSNRNYYRAQVISYYPDLFDAETLKKTEEILTNKTLETTEYNLEKIGVDVQEYKQNPQNGVTLTNLQKWRKQVANSWLNLGTENLENAYINSVGKAHKILINCGFQNEILTEEERSFVNEIKTYLIPGLNQPKALQYLLAGMLYVRADRLQLKFDKAPIPKWFANDYLKYMFSSPSLFLEIGEADNYARYMEKWLEYINNNITNNQDSKLWQEIAQLFTQNANFIPIYFASFNLKKLYSLRAQIIEFYLKNQGSHIDYKFPTRSQNRNKIRLGIIKEHFIPQSETYSTLPVFEHLNREKFEIILYANNLTNHPLEQYCCSCVDRVVKLENDTQKQVQTIRNDDLDILVVGTNITAITRPITLLMFHRLARIQTTLFSSPVTTGIRNIDYYISGKLSETITLANQHYTEKLALLENVGFCFNYYPVSSTPAQVYPTRQSWKATDETTIFISGANFYKIIPELAETWAKILAAIPNSILVLYPFAPSWSSKYPAIPFLNRMHQQIAKYKVDKKRLVLIKALPTRTDVKECLKKADIYLDSYPYSGSNSLVDPLEIGIPTVVMDGEFLRQKQGAAMLRSLSISDLIADSEAEYINLAIKLAKNHKFRQQKRQEIQEKIQQNPSFLDSHSYSAEIGKLFQELFQKWQNFHAPKTIESQDNNSLTSEFINRLVGCVNLYKIDPNDQSLIEELRQIRKQIADFWLGVLPKELETIYQGKVRQAYLALLASGIQNEPQTEQEEKFIKELADTSMGLTNPKAINALLGGMLYFPPGKMLVRDAKNRLPQWLINDYKQVFESREVAQKLEKAFQAKSPHLSEDSIGRGWETQPLKTTEAQTEKNVVLTENKIDNLDSANQKFLNHLLGSVNLYYIDRSDESVVQELRKLRKQTADFWINLEPQKLETFYLGEMGKGYQALLNSGIQNQSLIESEREFLQQLATQLSQGIEAPKAINYLLAAMLYCHSEQLRIEDMDKLPHWLLEDYQKFAGD